MRGPDRPDRPSRNTRVESTLERVFNISGMTADAKRKKLNPENLCNATMCADQNKHFPVSAEELQKASSK